MDENGSYKKLETVGEVAPMLKMTEQALYEAVRKGLVPVVRIGRRIRFDLDAIERWLESGGSPWGVFCKCWGWKISGGDSLSLLL